MGDPNDPLDALMLNVALVIERTGAEGPGERYALWVQGCPMRCAGCCNPEMLPFVERSRRAVRSLVDEALAQRAHGVEGVSLLGGEPFSQAEALAVFAGAVREGGLSVMVYTGYTIEELERSTDPHARALLSKTDLLVDGRYEQARRSTARRWIGSENQRLHFLTDRYKQDDRRFSAPNTVEIRMKNGSITINGWPVHGAKTKLGGARGG
jgi:anaerobic ribonucleoside-triphosphate reductase activating protein